MIWTNITNEKAACEEITVWPKRNIFDFATKNWNNYFWPFSNKYPLLVLFGPLPANKTGLLSVCNGAEVCSSAVHLRLLCLRLPIFVFPFVFFLSFPLSFVIVFFFVFFVFFFVLDYMQHSTVHLRLLYHIIRSWPSHPYWCANKICDAPSYQLWRSPMEPWNCISSQKRIYNSLER